VANGIDAQTRALDDGFKVAPLERYTPEPPLPARGRATNASKGIHAQHERAIIAGERQRGLQTGARHDGGAVALEIEVPRSNPDIATEPKMNANTGQPGGQTSNRGPSCATPNVLRFITGPHRWNS
jgi:hypothetical protein